LLVDLYPAFAPALSGLVPALTKPLAPGVAFAEDPGTGDSFGLHRCFLIADGIVRAAEAGRASPTEQVETVAERFAENGLSLERPYLNAASTDEYAVPAP
jgi:hypothetical protein